MQTNKYEKTLEESIITAMDGDSVGLLKYLPYILQDFWEIGASPEEIIKIIRKHKTDYPNLSVLDIGSGKGAVSVKIARELKCKCFGIVIKKTETQSDTENQRKPKNHRRAA